MKSTLGQHRTRQTAAVMLFVWLLTLGVGIANACLLHEDHAQAGYERNPTGVMAHAGMDAVQSAPATSAGAGDEAALMDPIACRTQCMAAQMAVPAQMAVACGDRHDDPVLVATCGPARVLADPVAIVSGITPAPSPESPVYIRFLRLTL